MYNVEMPFTCTIRTWGGDEMWFYQLQSYKFH
uniref:Uncharacterized protein n=1 Tax=Arundo donax TaxID=35708 RepID=A0A0A9HEE2_ARUDO